jgi:glycosyltransferase involved in cell wall biosynthesis
MNELRRVLFTESSPNIGGQELQLLAQAAGLVHAGVDTLLACRPHSRIAEVAQQRGIQVEHIPFRNSLHPPSLMQMRRLLHRYRPDAVIAHSGHDANTVALAARMLRKRPLLVRARTYQPGIPNAWTYNVLFDLTLVPSLYLKDRLLENPRIRAERIQVLYPGISFDGHADAATPPPWLAELIDTRRRIMLHAAMLRPEKGHGILLKALPELAKRFPDICYVIAGEGELSSVLREQVSASGLEGHVVFAGMVDNVAAVMKHAELVVMPSSYEPLGMSQIEALGMQIPVVASRTGGIPETVEHQGTGLLAEPDNVDDWREKLAWALAHPDEMRNMAHLGCTKVRAQFSISGNLDQLQQHLHSGIAKLHAD